MKRKICFIITSHIHYARSTSILQELKKRKDVELQIIVGASAILPQYGDVLSPMAEDGLTPDATITMTLAGGTTVAMAKTTGVGIIEFATAFENLRPDIVVLRGDRYEILAAAVAAAYMNIPIAHLEGGDSTGSIDESVRHAVTKLSHLHFATNEASKKRILQMGENPQYVWNVGCAEVEQLARHRAKVTSADVNHLGVGHPLNINKPFAIVIHHPVTTEAGKNRQHTELLLDVLEKSNIPTLWFWPNIDAGTDEISKAIRVFREKGYGDHMHFAKYFDQDTFIALLKKCSCLIGNSSSGIKEASFLGIPTVNIGDRQYGRLHGENVIDAGYNKTALQKAILSQFAHGRYKRNDLYYKKNCSASIAKIIATADLYVQKHFHAPHVQH